MTSSIQPVALIVFCACFLLVTGAGFWAVRWRRSELTDLDEWGLAGRKFGTLVTWFLIGGDLSRPPPSLPFRPRSSARAPSGSSPFPTASSLIR